MHFTNRAWISNLARNSVMACCLAVLSPTILVVAQSAFAASYPASDADKVVRFCLAETPRIFQLRGVPFSPAAAQQFCLCSAEVVQKQIPLARYKGATRILAKIKAGKPLNNEQKRQLAQFQSVGIQLARRCGCLIRSSAPAPYRELVKPPAECPGN